MTQPRSTAPKLIEQFAYGKLIEAGRDVRGYTVVARSAAAPNDSLISRIRACASIGSPDLDTYPGSDMAFALDDFVAIARFQRSPRKYERGHFLQEHYLIVPQTLFNTLGNNYFCLLPSLPAEIPWRSQDDVLPVLLLPTRICSQEVTRVEQALNVYGDQIFQMLRLVLDDSPFAVLPPRSAPHEGVACIEALSLLIPPSYRGTLSWATNVANASQCKARIKVIAETATGIEGKTLIRLGSRATQPAFSASDNAISYTNTLGFYRAHFGVPALLDMVETLPIDPSLSWSQLAQSLAIALWQRTGPAIIEKDLLTLQRPYHKNLLENILPFLDSTTYQITPHQRGVFLATLLAGALDGLLPLEETARISRDLSRPDMANAGAELIYQTLCGDIDRTVLPEQALTRLKWLATNHLIPMELNSHAGLLSRSLAKSVNPNDHKIGTLLTVWLDLSPTAEWSLKLARAVPSLASSLWPESTAYYAYIARGLSGAGWQEMDQILAQKSVAELESNVDIFMSLIIAGERFGIQGFRSSQMLQTIINQSHRLPGDRLIIMINGLERDLYHLNDKVKSQLVSLMLLLGQTQRFKALLDDNWKWIDHLIYWLETCNSLTPAYQVAVQLAIEWFNVSLSKLPVDEIHPRLRKTFQGWTTLTRGTPEAINDLVSLLFTIAFKPEWRKDQDSMLQTLADSIFRKRENEFVQRVVDDIRFVHESLFPANTSPARFSEYADRLTQTFLVQWKNLSLTRKLVKSLRDRNLKFEAELLSDVNYRQRGREIVGAFVTSLEQVLSDQIDVNNSLEELQELTHLQIVDAIPDQNTRMKFKEHCQNLLKEYEAARDHLRHLKENIR
jgi:hypothetical protein